MLDKISAFLFDKGQAATPYSYVFGPDTLGVGVMNAALVRPMAPIFGGGRYGPKYNVHGTIDAYSPAAQYPIGDYGPTVDLRANGVYLSGALALEQLADFNRKTGS